MCAIVRGPLHSDQASGNMGSLCYSRWRGRAVVRSAWSGTDPNTADQQTRRARLTAVSQRWGNVLSAADRQSWIDLAKSLKFPDRFGQLKGISGYNLFVKRNMNRYPFVTNYLDKPTEGGELFYVEVLELTFQVVYPRVWVRPRHGDVSNNQEYYDYWRAGPYDSPARNPIEGEWERKHQALASWYDYGITTSKYYWYRTRGGWNSGVFTSWWVEQVAT